MKGRSLKVWVYALADYSAAFLAWLFFYLFRKKVIESAPLDFNLLIADNNFTLALLLFPPAWVLLHYITGNYTDLYRKSRIAETARTFIVSLMGVTIVFFSFLLDDLVRRYSDYYLTYFMLLGLQFFFTISFRMLILFRVKNEIDRGISGYRTLIIGSNQRANELFERISENPQKLGYHFVGFLEMNGKSQNKLTEKLPELGRLENLNEAIDNNAIEEVIIAIETSEHHLLNEIINVLGSKNVNIKIIPDMYDILSRTARMHHIVGEAFIEIPPEVMSESERIVKRWIDVVASGMALIVLAVPMLIVALRIRFGSAGPVFYKQERLGHYGKPFMMLKFRSMYVDAEKGGPQLTKDNDNRITPIGQWMRRYRVDELPQFINVLKGEMSIVGPRAERKFFADQIVAFAPHYKHVLKVKPGITSLGMVKYGYASTVDEMVKRLKYDIIYIENMSLLMDFKIMAYTAITMLTGKGK